jgi:Spy/CpxP family protein refolding chaperone
MRIGRVALALVAIAVLAAGGAARAQAPGQTAPGGGGQAAKAQQIQEKILALRAAQITTELNLDEKTASKLFPILQQYDGQFAKLLADFRQLRLAAQAAADKGDTAALNDLIDKMVANQRARWDTQEARFKDVRKVLTAQQAARLLVVLPQIDRQIANRIRRALNRPGLRRRGRGAGQQPAPDDDDDGDPTDDDAPAQ